MGGRRNGGGRVNVDHPLVTGLALCAGVGGLELGPGGMATEMSSKPTRPVLRYHGGKWRLAPWIIGQFPEHRIYVEPYGGAASVLMQKRRSYAEVINDLDEEVVNVFRVLRDQDTAEQLRELLHLTPWSRLEFAGAYEPTSDPVERARRTIVRTAMAHGTTSRRKNRTGFRAKNYRRNQTGAKDWCSWPEQISAYVERLRGVTIESRPALEIIEQQDTPETLFYVDPPYMLETRSTVRANSQSDRDRAYAHDLSDEDHAQLAEVLHRIDGMAIVSGYPCDRYEQLYSSWEQLERRVPVDGGQTRTEVLWVSPRARSQAPQLEILKEF